MATGAATHGAVTTTRLIGAAAVVLAVVAVTIALFVDRGGSDVPSLVMDTEPVFDDGVYRTDLESLPGCGDESDEFCTHLVTAMCETPDRTDDTPFDVCASGIDGSNLRTVTTDVMVPGALSPDGRYLLVHDPDAALIRPDGTRRELGADGDARIGWIGTEANLLIGSEIVTAEGEPVVSLAAFLDGVELATPPAPSPDGNRFAAVVRDADGTTDELRIFDLDTGQTTSVSVGPDFFAPFGVRLGWTSDGGAVTTVISDRSIVTGQVTDDGFPFRVVKIDADTGDLEVIHEFWGLGIWGVTSPDGSTMAVASRHGLVFVELATGKASNLVHVRRSDPSGGQSWSPDSRFVVLDVVGPTSTTAVATMVDGELQLFEVPPLGPMAVLDPSFAGGVPSPP